MAFRELAEKIDLPSGASARYRQLEALERMLTGELYSDLKYSFDEEKVPGKSYIPLRERRPSVDFCLAYEITQDTLSELFGDEQFPTVKVLRAGDEDDKATKAVSTLVEAINLEQVLSDTYEEGVVGSVGVVIQRSDDGSPFYDILPGKWCEPVYTSKYSNALIALVVTYPINKDAAEEISPGITERDENKGSDTYWYRYIVGPVESLEYHPMSDRRFARLGERDDQGNLIEFVELGRQDHGFKGRTPAIYVKNLGGKHRDIDGPALWWPIRNICIEIDYSLSQAGRGLRYAADPMLFVRKGEIDNGDTPAGYEEPAGGMATQTSESGDMVRGATQVLVGRGPQADAKLLEISANGIKEEREFVRDLREYALEVLGGMKARAEHLKGAQSGVALDKGLKPLRRLVRRQRRPYGRGALLDLINLTLYGISVGAIEVSDADVDAIPLDSKNVLDWPNDDTLQGAELLAHVEGLQYAAGGSVTAPVQLIDPEVIGAKLASDLGLHQAYQTIKGSCELPPEPEPDPEPKPSATP